MPIIRETPNTVTCKAGTMGVPNQTRKRKRPIQMNQFVRSVIKRIRQPIKKKRNKRKTGGRLSVIGRHGATSGRGRHKGGAVLIGGVRIGHGPRPAGSGLRSAGRGTRSAGGGTFFRGNVSNSRSGQRKRIRTVLPRAGGGLRRAGEGAKLSAQQKKIFRTLL